MAAPSADGRRHPLSLLLVVVVGLVAAGHTLLYVLSVPIWATEDEEQHVDYVLELRDERRVPHLDDPLRQQIVDSAVTTNRWPRYGVARPDWAIVDQRLVPERMGLEGFSYEGHQPPLYYAALVPVAGLLGDQVQAIVYAGRLFGVGLAAAGAVLAALLSARLSSPARAPVAAWVGGLCCALMPAVAESSARVNNDYACAVLFTGGVLCLMWLLDAPGVRPALVGGGVFAAAALTKAIGVAGLAVTGVALAVLLVRRKLTARIVGALVVPQLASIAVWSWAIHDRYGTWDPAQAFVQQRYRHPTVPWSLLGSDALQRGATPFGAGTWPHDQFVTALWIALVAVGLVAWVATDRRLDRALVVATPMACAAGGYVLMNRSGIVNTFTARYLVFAYPTLLAAAAAGWVGIRRVAFVPVVPVAVAAGTAAFFLWADFLPRFPLRLG